MKRLFGPRGLTLVTTWIAFGLLSIGLWQAKIAPDFTEFGHLATQAGFLVVAVFFTAVALYSEDW